jgi:hypothetical protein
MPATKVPEGHLKCPNIRNHIVFRAKLDENALVEYIIECLQQLKFPVISSEKRDAFIAVEVFSGLRKYSLEIYPCEKNETGQYYRIICKRTLGKLSLLCGKSEDAELHQLVGTIADIVYARSEFSEIQLGSDAELPSFINSSNALSFLPRLMFGSGFSQNDGIIFTGLHKLFRAIGNVIHGKKSVSDIPFGSDAEASLVFNAFDKFIIGSRVLLVSVFLLSFGMIFTGIIGSADLLQKVGFSAIIILIFLFFYFISVICICRSVVDIINSYRERIKKYCILPVSLAVGIFFFILAFLYAAFVTAVIVVGRSE